MLTDESANERVEKVRDKRWFLDGESEFPGRRRHLACFEDEIFWIDGKEMAFPWEMPRTRVLWKVLFGTTSKWVRKEVGTIMGAKKHLLP